jgi:hypothetical protein
MGLDRPLGLQDVEAPRISRQSAQEGGKAVSRTHWPPLPPRRNRGNAFLLEQTTIRNRYYLNIQMEIRGIRFLGDACCTSRG